MAELNEQEQEVVVGDDLAMGQFILSARIYDVLMALLQKQDPEYALDLLEMHSKGIIVGSAPSFNGAFLTDMMNGDDLGQANEEPENEDTDVDD
jgi:hypothetical protein